MINRAKKLIITLLALALAVCQLSASMYMFQMDHPVYDEMDALYIMEGKTTGLGIKPWSDTDVRHMLQDVTPSSDTAKVLKAHIESYLESLEKKTRLYFDVSITPGVAYHTNADEFDSADDWYSDSTLDDTLADLKLGFSYKEYLMGFVDFSVGFNYAAFEDLDDITDFDIRYKEDGATNILGVSEGTFSANMPNRAFLVTGGDGFRANVGRDRLSWGNGMMGNLMLGDTLPYHNFFSATFTGSEHFSYQMLISFFTHSVDYINKSIKDDVNGLRFFLGHRFEFSFLEHRLKFVLNEAIMYQSENGYLNPGVLNPLMFLHNLYISENANSLVTAEVEWSPAKNWSLYMQAAVDEFQLPGESSDLPSAWGLMAGVRHISPKGINYSYSGFEFVYTNPYLYHRTDSEYDLYYTAAIRAYYDEDDYVDDGMRILIRYLSLPYGSDSIAGLYRFGYNNLQRYKLEGDVMFLVHGIMNEYSEVNSKQDYSSTPTTSNSSYTGDYYSSLQLEDGEVEYSLIFGGRGSLKITRWLSLSGSMFFNIYWNKDNVDENNAMDVQLSLGLKIEI